MSVFFADNAPILGNKFSTTWRPQGDYIHLKVVFTVQENALLVCSQRHRTHSEVEQETATIQIFFKLKDFKDQSAG